MNIELLQQLCEASAVSGDEQEVRNILINTLESCVNEITFDGLGSFVARKGNKGPKVAVVGHMDASRLYGHPHRRERFSALYHHWRLVESVDAQPPGNHTHTQGI